MGYKKILPDGTPAASTAMDWKDCHIFFCSTFTDMQLERDLLRDNAFLRVKEELIKRRHDLHILDLRQGVETSEMVDELAREEKVLSVCLNAIDRARPFFISTIGDRYGSMFSTARLQLALLEKRIKTDDETVGITELEIMHGVLTNPNTSLYNIYIREMDYTDMPPEMRMRYDERALFDEDIGYLKLRNIPLKEQQAARDRWKRLERLKSRIRSILPPERVHTYKVRWQASQTSRGMLVGLEDLNQMVFRNLWSDMDAATNQAEREMLSSWQDRDREAMHTFVHAHSVYYVDRPEVAPRIIDFSLAPDGPEGARGLMLEGDSGSGKSAVFSHILGQLQKRSDVTVLAHSAGIFPESGSIGRMISRWTSELAEHTSVKEQCSRAKAEEIHSDPFADSPDRSIMRDRTLMDDFARYLSQVAKTRRVVIMLDGLDQMELPSRAHQLGWLPSKPPANTRYIFTIMNTTSDGKVAPSSLSSRMERLEMPRLNREQALQIAHKVFKIRYNREVNRRSLEILLDKRAPATSTVPEEDENADKKINALVWEIIGPRLFASIESGIHRKLSEMEREAIRCRRRMKDSEKHELEKLLSDDPEKYLKELVNIHERGPIDGGACHGNPLWLELALQEMNLLEADDYDKAEEQFQHLLPHERMDQLLASVASEIAPTVSGVCRRLLDRAARVCGAEFSESILNVLALGRHGWREGDLRGILSRMSGKLWDGLSFESLTRIIGRQLSQHGTGGLWSITQSQLVQAILRRNMPAIENPGFAEADGRDLEIYREKVRTSLRWKVLERIADHLFGLPVDDPVRQREQAYHLLKIEDFDRLVAYVAAARANDDGWRIAAHDFVGASGSRVGRFPGHWHSLGVEVEPSLDEQDHPNEPAFVAVSARRVFDSLYG